MTKKDNLILIILSGIPCSGKSTWIRKNINILAQKFHAPVIIVSRDNIRESLFDMSRYKYNSIDENKVTEKFYRQLSHALALENAVVILDNTHAKPSYLDTYFNMFKVMIDNGRIDVYVKFFDIPLWKARWRNFWRSKETGKHIPLDALKNMLKNYNKLDKSKYQKYLYHE